MGNHHGGNATWLLNNSQWEHETKCTLVGKQWDPRVNVLFRRGVKSECYSKVRILFILIIHSDSTQFSPASTFSSTVGTKLWSPGAILSSWPENGSSLYTLSNGSGQQTHVNHRGYNSCISGTVLTEAKAYSRGRWAAVRKKEPQITCSASKYLLSNYYAHEDVTGCEEQSEEQSRHGHWHPGASRLVWEGSSCGPFQTQYCDT